MKKLLFILTVLVTLFSCDKTEKQSNKLSGETWEVKSLKINSESSADLPILLFEECSIYKETCYGSWELNSTSSSFAWQFREKGTIFEISNQSVVTVDKEDAIIQCMNLSGVYNVDESSKTELKISSSSTIGYPDESVEITLKLK